MICEHFLHANVSHRKVWSNIWVKVSLSLHRPDELWLDFFFLAQLKTHETKYRHHRKVQIREKKPRWAYERPLLRETNSKNWKDLKCMKWKNMILNLFCLQQKEDQRKKQHGKKTITYIHYVNGLQQFYINDTTMQHYIYHFQENSRSNLWHGWLEKSLNWTYSCWLWID